MKKTLTLFTFSFLLLSFAGSGQYKALVNFNGPNGKQPWGDVTQSGRNLYGMTNYGGRFDKGCIFSVDTNGTGYTDILDFNDTNGANPWGSLLLAGNELYGMTTLGGAHAYGRLFAININGSGYRDIVDFNWRSDPYGATPEGSLLLIGNRLFGMTYSSGLGWLADGCIFSVDTNGHNYKDLTDFNVGNNGYNPTSSLIYVGNKLFGMVQYGGANGRGLIFSIDTNGAAYKDIHDFIDSTGTYPFGSLIFSKDKLYGLAVHGGTNSDGVIFSLDTNGNGYTDMLDFSATNGYSPSGSLLIAGSNLYGLASGGGQFNDGCLFSIDTNGSGYTRLYNFSNADGINPYGSLILSANVFYGMTPNGGAGDSGVVFSFKDTIGNLGVNNATSIHSTINVYPNPNNGSFNLSIRNQALGMNSRVEVYNILGEKVFISNLNASNTQIDLSNNANGIYLYRVLAETGNLVSTGKFVIQK